MTVAHVVGCTGKKRFVRFGTADRAATRMRRNDDESHCEAYHCKHCNGFHLGEARAYGKRNAKKEMPT